ncbi:unnamed protein product, partial [Polarella glacialis]
MEIQVPKVKSLGMRPFSVRVMPHVPGACVMLSLGSVVDFAGDVVVNAANTGCLGGGGVDGAISAAGGKAMAEARQALPVLDKRMKRCDTGDAKVTTGGSLKARWCVHAVGPNYRVLEGIGGSCADGDALLRSAYLAAMQRSQEVKAATIGFSLLSAGIFRGSRPLVEVLAIGLEAVETGAYPGLEAVHLVAFTDKE